LRIKFDFVLVFVWDFPFILKWNSWIILDWNLLLWTDSNVSRWEEHFLVITNIKCWFIAMTNQINLLDVRWIVVVYPLCKEVVISRRFRVEFKTNNTEWLSLDQAFRWVCFESLSRVFEHFIINWSIRSILNLNSCINWFIWTTWWECNVFLWIELNHWNKWLWSRWETVTNKSNVHANRRINFFIHGIIIFRFLHWT